MQQNMSKIKNNDTGDVNTKSTEKFMVMRCKNDDAGIWRLNMKRDAFIGK